jgi:hypothetical protein
LRTLLPEPGAANDPGVKTAVTPLGSPVTENLTAASKPPLTVTFRVRLLFDPAVTGRELADGVA